MLSGLMLHVVKSLADLLLDTAGRPGKDKAAPAGRLRLETTMTLNWIADRLNPGTAGSLANQRRDTEWKR
jgi:hypothetical protein